MPDDQFVSGGSRPEGDVLFCDGFKYNYVHDTLAGGVRKWNCSARGGQTKVKISRRKRWM